MSILKTLFYRNIEKPHQAIHLNFQSNCLSISVPENCLDRHVKKNPDHVALIWEKDEPGQQEIVTYRYCWYCTCIVFNIILQDVGQKETDAEILQNSHSAGKCVTCQQYMIQTRKKRLPVPRIINIFLQRHSLCPFLNLSSLHGECLHRLTFRL